MKEITVESLRKFFKRPSQRQIEKEAGLPKTALSHILREKDPRPLTPEVIEKLKPILKKYNL